MSGVHIRPCNRIKTALYGVKFHQTSGLKQIHMVVNFEGERTLDCYVSTPFILYGIAATKLDVEMYQIGDFYRQSCSSI